ATGTMFARPSLWAAAVAGGTLGGRILKGHVAHFGPLPWPLASWTGARDVPIPPTESYRAWYARTHHEDGSLK
ncbi:MAG TPA: (4Fe-4S)-binding protein, partial [Propionibacteriaceae bacterium]|nr:(4Fe-4S)-binding protein [Propionibacteriaceae bacterium]